MLCSRVSDATGQRKPVVNNNWVESPTPVKPSGRVPKLEADGTLVFSDDEFESPMKHKGIPAVGKSPVNKHVRDDCAERMTRRALVFA